MGRVVFPFARICIINTLQTAWEDYRYEWIHILVHHCAAKVRLLSVLVCLLPQHSLATSQKLPVPDTVNSSTLLYHLSNKIPSAGVYSDPASHSVGCA